MNKSSRVGFSSALLVNTGVIIGAFAFSLLAWWLKADAIAILLLTLAATGLISRVWGKYSLKDLSVTLKAQSSILSVGQSETIDYRIENNKFLPLVWLEICQDVPKNGCMVPDGSMKLRTFTEEEAQASQRSQAYMRRFAFLMGHSELSWSCKWTGVKRGVYRPDNVVIRSGDGFGLTQSIGETTGLKGTAFVVWPKIIPVHTAPLLRNILNGNAGRYGYAEDISVLRDEREYQNGDSWKRIDWRTAARTDELYTKRFETIRPQSLILAIETVSFEDPEEALSLAASLIYELNQKGIRAGLALPATAEKEAVFIRPDDPSFSFEDCLFELADHDADSAIEDSFQVRGILNAAQECGHVWIFGECRKDLITTKLASALNVMPAGYITRQGDAGSIPFASIRMEGGAE